MTVWLLIIAYHTGGRITMYPGPVYRTAAECAEAGRAAQRDHAARGETPASLCREVRR
jgi:hypothetical protein